MIAPKYSSFRLTLIGPTFILIPSGLALVFMTSIVCGKHCSSTKNLFALELETLLANAIASAAAVASSRREALEISKPVKSEIKVWKLIRASSLP